MAYCTLTDVQRRLPSLFINVLTNDAGGNTLVQEPFDEAVEDADSLINSYLRSRYAVPFATAPKVVNRIAVDLVIYFLYQRKSDMEMTDAIRARYKDSIKLLEGIQTGVVNIDDVPSGETVIPAIVKTNKTSADRMFGRSVLDRF